MTAPRKMRVGDVLIVRRVPRGQAVKLPKGYALSTIARTHHDGYAVLATKLVRKRKARR